MAASPAPSHSSSSSSSSSSSNGSRGGSWRPVPEVRELDLSSLDSVQRFSHAVTDGQQQPSLVVCNAGTHARGAPACQGIVRHWLG